MIQFNTCCATITNNNPKQQPQPTNTTMASRSDYYREYRKKQKTAHEKNTALFEQTTNKLTTTSQQLEEAKLTIIQLTKQLTDIKTNSVTNNTIVMNAKQLLSTLPQNSDIRLPLLKQLSTNLTIKQASTTLNVSRSQISRACISNSTAIMRNRHGFKQQKRVLDKKWLSESIDRFIPTQSGRNYRLLTTSRRHKYQQYIQSVPSKATPLSYSFFNKFCRTLNIHNSQAKTVCPHCEMATTDGETDAFKLHIGTAKNQQNHLKTLRENQGTNTVIVVMDFTVVDFVTHHFNDLIFSIYFPFPSDLRHIHCVGGVGVKNDISFVIHSFRNFILPLLNGFKYLHIFNDGGPKHFKVSSLLYYFFTLQQLVPFQIFYHFFASYHGHSVCDSAASQFKRQVTNFVNESNTVPKFAWQVTLMAGDVKTHSAVVADPSDLDVDFIKTLAGIKSHHFFSFTSDCILASPLSSLSPSPSPTKMFPKIAN